MSPTVRVGETSALVSNLVNQLVQRLAADDAPERLVVGLAGAPGSGKSTIAEQLKTGLKAAGIFAGLVAMDGFHLSNAVLDELGRRNRKGAPDTFDVDGYLTTLDRVRADGAPRVLVPVYRRDLHEAVAAGSIVSGTGVVVTEGNYLALETRGWGAARERIDLLIHIDVPEEVLVPRLINRHEDFGKNPIAAGHWVRTVDLPNARLIATRMTTSPTSSTTPTTTSSRAPACTGLTKPAGPPTRLTAGGPFRALSTRRSGASARWTETASFHSSDYRHRAYPR